MQIIDVPEQQEPNPLDFRKWAKTVIEESIKPLEHKLKLKFPYDLRASLDMKVFDADMHIRWTAFLNQAGTLCHVVNREYEIIARVKFRYPINHMSRYNMVKTIMERVEPCIKI